VGKGRVRREKKKEDGRGGGVEDKKQGGRGGIGKRRRKGKRGVGGEGGQGKGRGKRRGAALEKFLLRGEKDGGFDRKGERPPREKKTKRRRKKIT